MDINKIYNEDCLETMKRMPDNFVDMTLTSPPYDNLRDYKGYSFDFESIAKELFRITKQGGVVVWVVGDATINGSESGTSFKQALFFKEIGFNLHDTMIWEKHSFNHDPRNKRYKQHFEFVFILSKGSPKTYNEIKDIPVKNAGNEYQSSKRLPNGEIRNYGKIKMNDYQARSNIWKIPQDTTNEHPAPFPEKLAADHIKSWSNEGDIVFDPMIGSGTTGKMAVMLKRNYIGSEISAEYTKLAEDRIRSISNPLF